MASKALQTMSKFIPVAHKSWIWSMPISSIYISLSLAFSPVVTLVLFQFLKFTIFLSALVASHMHLFLSLMPFLYFPPDCLLFFLQFILNITFSEQSFLTLWPRLVCFLFICTEAFTFLYDTCKCLINIC